MTRGATPVSMRPGDLVVLEEQDRSRWDQRQIAEALPLVEEALRGGPGSYALQAAIAAQHCQAARAEDTDWPQIVRLYDLLERVQPSPIVSLNRAVAVAMVDGPGRRSPSSMRWPQPAISTTIICCTPRVPTCCAASDPQRRRRRATSERWHWSPMTASADSSSGGCAKFSRRRRSPRQYLVCKAVAQEKLVNVLHIVGARPNFMKVAPVLNALRSHQHVVQTLVHTGQHYDANMSDVFFEQLGILAPDVNLAVGSGTHARQTAEIMTRFEPLVLERKPDIVLVYGDVNSTVAAALVAPSSNPRRRVEAGLRSFDRAMPEEVKQAGGRSARRDVCIRPAKTETSTCSARSSREDLRRQRHVIDFLVKLCHSASGKAKIISERYALVLLHRPANVDDSAT